MFAGSHLIQGMDVDRSNSGREGAVQGQGVSREVREIYEKGLGWLIANQASNGGWESPSNPGPGVTGLSIMAFLAYGEDPNYGLHCVPVRKALQNLILNQDPRRIFGGEACIIMALQHWPWQRLTGGG